VQVDIDGTRPVYAINTLGILYTSILRQMNRRPKSSDSFPDPPNIFILANMQKLLIFQVLMRSTTIIVIVTLFLSSCVTNKDIFINELFSGFNDLKIDKAIAFEKKNKSKDFSPTYLIGIGEGIYPNENNYKLETPRIFKRSDKPGFQIEIDYFYVLSDSSVKVILYQWDVLPSKEKKSFEDDKSDLQNFSRFQTKFNQLSDSLTRVLGSPVQKNIDQSKVSSGETFRDDVKWHNENGLNAYLFMFGNNESGYRQIRLAIYGD
jgi:hypothetical protein